MEIFSEIRPKQLFGDTTRNGFGTDRSSDSWKIPVKYTDGCVGYFSFKGPGQLVRRHDIINYLYMLTQLTDKPWPRLNLLTEQWSKSHKLKMNTKTIHQPHPACWLKYHRKQRVAILVCDHLLGFYRNVIAPPTGWHAGNMCCRYCTHALNGH